MAAEVSYDATNHMIRVRVQGEETIEDWEASKAQIIKLNSERGCSNVLVDAREQQAAPGMLELFEFATHWPPTIRVAKLVGPKTRAAQGFVETVAVNRGIPMKDFTNERDAMAWLIK